jgi:hypothetical protein
MDSATARKQLTDAIRSRISMSALNCPARNLAAASALIEASIDSFALAVSKDVIRAEQAGLAMAASLVLPEGHA